MSHVKTNTKITITDLDCLERAVALFPKLHWKRDQKKFEWFGKWVKDYHGDDAAYKNGINPETYGQCEHCIEVDGGRYSVGVVKREDGTGYSLVWDTWNGSHIAKAIGNDAEKLMTAYNQEYTQAWAEANGYMLQQEVNAAGHIVATLMQ